MLVVIAIISILAAFLLPAIRTAQNKAELVICTSNQKQVYLGMSLFANENRGRLYTLGVSGQYEKISRYGLSKYWDVTGNIGDIDAKGRLIYAIHRPDFVKIGDRKSRTTIRVKSDSYLENWRLFGCPPLFRDPTGSSSNYPYSGNWTRTEKSMLLYGYHVNWLCLVQPKDNKGKLYDRTGLRGIHRKIPGFNHPAHTWVRFCVFHAAVAGKAHTGIGSKTCMNFAHAKDHFKTANVTYIDGHVRFHDRIAPEYSYCSCGSGNGKYFLDDGCWGTRGNSCK